MIPMHTTFLSFGALALTLLPLAATPTAYDEAKSKAERLFNEKSFQAAREVYLALKPEEIPDNEKRWVDFRLADTQWRSAPESSDTTEVEQALKKLNALVRDRQREDERDLVWAEAMESQADYHWLRAYRWQAGPAFPLYAQALDWWASSPQIDYARVRYIRIVRKMTVAPRADIYFPRFTVPREILENYRTIAKEPADLAHASYLLAMSLSQSPQNIRDTDRARTEFRTATAAAAGTPWLDDALMAHAQFLQRSGRRIEHDDGRVTNEPDFEAALAVYRRILREFTKESSAHWEQARQMIEEISKPIAQVSVDTHFLPGSLVRYRIDYRNTPRIRLTLHKTNLGTEFNPAAFKGEIHQWIQGLKTGETVQSWTIEGRETSPHSQGQVVKTLATTPPPGAYLLVCTANGAETTRALVLVSDTSLVLKASSEQTFVYVCDVLSGEPRPEQPVVLWFGHYDRNDTWIWKSLTATTDASGLARFQPELNSDHGFHFIAFSPSAPSWASTHFYNHRQSRSDQKDPEWKIYAETDRPAYRPKETMHWKITARTRLPGEGYTVPSGRTLFYRINDPRGSELHKGTVTLSDYGTAWGSVELGADLPLGEYQIEFREESIKGRSAGAATLFRLEEYKLPEYKVTVRTPEDNGRPKTFRTGDTVEALVLAEYYSGGPVVDAEVEFVVKQAPYVHFWKPRREFTWLYEDIDGPNFRNWGGHQVVKQEKARTGADGTAVVRFDTPAGMPGHFEYTIEARVIDSSRREINGTGTVRVTAQRYFVQIEPSRRLAAPGDKITATITAQDANNRPLEVTGSLELTRERWEEIWIDPTGREVKDAALDEVRRSLPVFPPAPRPDQPGWRLKYRGYRSESISTHRLKTGPDGRAEFSFTTDRNGYYKLTWIGRDPGSAPILGDTTVWVTDGQVTDLGYRSGGVEILVDSDTIQPGRTIPVLLVTSTSNRHVLFTVEQEKILSCQVLHVTGTAKVAMLEITADHVPNLFLSALMVADGRLQTASKQLVIPPTAHFLKVEVTADKEVYRPRDSGTIRIRTTTHDGQPVPAEVSLGLIDESLFYIQQDLAEDPREFFFRDKRPNVCVTSSTLHQRMFQKLEKIPAADDQEILIDLLTPSPVPKPRRQGEMSDQIVNHFSRITRMDGLAMVEENEMSADMPMMSAAAPASRGFMLGRGRAAGMGQVSGFVFAEKNTKAKSARDEAPGEQSPAVVVRSDFRSTVFWQPDLRTGPDGTATVKVTYPDSTTGWRATTRATTTGIQFGQGSASTRSRQDLIARLQIPRFLVAGDEAVITGVFNNNTDKPMTLTPVLEAEGVTLAGIWKDGAAVKRAQPALTVPANGTARADWVVTAARAGRAVFKLTGRAGQTSDAMELACPVVEYGIEKFIGLNGKIKTDDASLSLHLPKERRPGSATLRVQVTPSLAVTMLDALPYLIDYPYGCVEQTMSRFLPCAVVGKTLDDLNIPSATVMGRLFGGIEQAHTDKTQPRGRRDLKELEAMIRTGLDRIYDMQKDNGGWGWWKQTDPDDFMTAYVVWCLAVAADSDIDVRSGVISRGRNYLRQQLVQYESEPAMQAWLLHAMAVSRRHAGNAVSNPEKVALENLFQQRDQLNAFSRALLALAAHHYKDAEKTAILLRNMVDGAIRDNQPDASILVPKGQISSDDTTPTAHWGGSGTRYHWSDGTIETTATVLRALVTIDPKHELVEPTVNWLLKNRRGAQWSNTRDTTMVVLALNEYLRASRELAAEVDYTVTLNDREIGRGKVTRANVLNAPATFQVDPALLRDGANIIRIRKKGGSPLYVSAHATYFSLETPIPSAGHEIFVHRAYFRQKPVRSLLKGVRTVIEPLKDGDPLDSGDRVEVILTIEAKNHYEYLVFEDLKPAGLEAVELRSGNNLSAFELKSGAAARSISAQPPSPGTPPVPAPFWGFGWFPRPGPDAASDFTGRSRLLHQEFRDRKVAFFVDKLPQGLWQIRYELRAEVPGTFTALPTLGHAMYVPEIRCNSVSQRFVIGERPQ
jgi:uncharacterized protein YfaS (alpha-2-macroglobulin family)